MFELEKISMPVPLYHPRPILATGLYCWCNADTSEPTKLT